jgi:hypothetical protein
MQQKKKVGVDVILDVLKETLAANPESDFIKSLLFQYQERGGLSKKQLEGLLGKASKVVSISEAKLATLEAIILKNMQNTGLIYLRQHLFIQRTNLLERSLMKFLKNFPSIKEWFFTKPNLTTMKLCPL